MVLALSTEGIFDTRNLDGRIKLVASFNCCLMKLNRETNSMDDVIYAIRARGSLHVRRHCAEHPVLLSSHFSPYFALLCKTILKGIFPFKTTTHFLLFNSLKSGIFIFKKIKIFYLRTSCLLSSSE